MNGTLLQKALNDIQADKNLIIENWKDQIAKGSQGNYLKFIGQQALEDWLNALLQDIGDGVPDLWDNVSIREASRLASMGIEEDIFRIALGCLTKVLWDYAMDTWQEVPAVALQFLREADIHIIRGRTEMAGVFLNRRLEMIKKQQQAILELSTPVIPLLENILIVPLIGTIDTARANQIMENILYGITEREADIVIIDITGVHIVDTTVAHHIIKAYQASRLLGAKCILVGMRPEVAQTIVQLDISFENMDTRNTLAQGIQYALHLQGKRIVDIAADEVS